MGNELYIYIYIYVHIRILWLSIRERIRIELRQNVPYCSYTVFASIYVMSLFLCKFLKKVRLGQTKITKYIASVMLLYSMAARVMNA